MKYVGYVIIMFFLMVSCGKDDDNSLECSESGNCDKCIIINRDLYNQTNTDNYTIQTIKVNQDCLEIEFASSGCSGSSWVISLIDLGAISETAVPQRDLKLRLKNSEICEAYITRTISFDLKPLKLENYDELSLKVAEYNSLIRYEY